MLYCRIKLSKFENFPFFKFIIKSGRLYIGNFSNPCGAINLNSFALLKSPLIK